MATTYRVTAERSEGWWVIVVPDVPVCTQARRLDQVELMAKDALALLLESPEDEIEIDLEVILDDDGEAALALASGARQAAVDAAEAARRAAQTAARTLHGQGLPLRDVGRIMGVSHQRVHQLLHA